MNLKSTFQLFKYPILCFALATGLSSCKKEYTDLPYNDIEAFTIEDANGKLLQAVIKDEEIIVYWTPLKDEPEFITPTIRISEQAKISPASGEKVIYSDGTKYTVTAQDGQKKTYTLRTQGGQPAPYFSLVNPLAFKFNNDFVIHGDYFLPDTEKTKLYLTQGGKETEITDIRTLTNSSIRMYVPVTLDIDTGQYHLKLVTGKRTVSHGPYTLLRPDYNSLIDRVQVATSGVPGETISLDLRDSKGAAYYKDEQYEVTAQYHTEPTVQIWPGTIKLQGTKLSFTIPADARKGNLQVVIQEVKTKAWRYNISSFTIK